MLKGGLLCISSSYQRLPSHACVRMQAKDAKWIFDWADKSKVSAKTGAVTKTGTLVIPSATMRMAPQPWLNSTYR
ncbi:MAG: L,D-transpeptidase [Chitinophagaceae bacterium]|nr:L,D-transpeptidase [Chitinophagaceae bacterium]